ncbi:MAG: hypothetical protein N2578_06155 [Bdellovibrionaceae bacterium]|nr:hypothetical protein [Pseudobdellovibrionaceae bacterium]
MRQSRKGQVLVEYFLLLVIVVAIATLMTREFASRDSDDPGILVKRWRQVANKIADDHPDRCVGQGCKR